MIKRLFLLFVFAGIFPAITTAQKAKPLYKKYTWYAGLAKAKEEKKLFLTYIAQNNCSYCKELDKNIKKDTALVRFMNQHFIMAKHNASQTYGKAIVYDYYLSTTPAIMLQYPDSEKDPKILYGIQNAADLRKALEDFIAESSPTEK